jgi:hypothetical protein
MPASAVPLASNARPAPEIFALQVVVEVRAALVVGEGASAGAAEEAGADDWKTQQSSYISGQMWHVWERCSIALA